MSNEREEKMMRRRPFIRLAPLLATASLVALPAVAQATPHYYVDGVKAAEGKMFPSISWGTLTLVERNPERSPPLSCENAVLGEYKNPTGGDAGEAVTDNVATANCADTECPEEDGLEPQVHSENLPWGGGLVESAANILLETKKTELVVGCYDTHTSTLAGSPTICTGGSDPELKNGAGTLSQGASKILFTGQSDKLECVVAGAEEGAIPSEGITEKSLNTMAYGSPVPTKKVNPLTTNTGQATLEAKNP